MMIYYEDIASNYTRYFKEIAEGHLIEGMTGCGDPEVLTTIIAHVAGLAVLNDIIKGKGKIMSENQVKRIEKQIEGLRGSVDRLCNTLEAHLQLSAQALIRIAGTLRGVTDNESLRVTGVLDTYEQNC